MDCNGCTFCCEILKVEWLGKPAVKTCMYEENGGCRIHDKLPAECRDFECAYFQAGNDIELRPDNAGVMFEKIGEHIFLATKDPRRVMSAKGVRQVYAFVEQGYSVVMVAPGKNIKEKILLAEGHTNEFIAEELKKFSEQ